MGRTLDKRYGVSLLTHGYALKDGRLIRCGQRLQNFFHRPYRKMLKEFTQMAASQPFECAEQPLCIAFISLTKATLQYLNQADGTCLCC